MKKLRPVLVLAVVAVMLLMVQLTSRDNQTPTYTPKTTTAETEAVSETGTAEETAEAGTEEIAEAVPEPETDPEFPEEVVLQAQQAFVYDVNRDKLVAIKGKGEKLIPASTTKLLTILTGLNYLSLDTAITPGNELESLAADASFAYVKENHTLSAEQLIEGMLLPSGNDAALVYGAAAGRAAGFVGSSGKGACQYFAQRMNTYAENLGMTGSNFVSVDGYYDEDHYSTVEDMVLLARAAYENETIRKYCGLAEDHVTYLSGHTNTWINTNKMLDPESEWYSPYVTGMKTGSANGVYCLISILEKDGKTYLAGVFTCPTEDSRYSDTQALIDWLFAEE